MPDTRRSTTAWNSMRWRAGNKNGKHPTYAAVEIRMTREEFVSWYEANWFPGCSVDRIDPNGHYELSNVRMLTRGENSRLRPANKNVRAPEGKHWCSGQCKDYLPITQFHKNRAMTTGLNKECRSCVKELRKKRRSVNGTR